MCVRYGSSRDICCHETRGLVPPLHTHHRPQAHPRRPRQPIPKRRHATVLAPLLLERQKLAAIPETRQKRDKQQTKYRTIKPRTSTNQAITTVSPTVLSS